MNRSMKYKSTLSLTFLLFSLSAYSQNKKEQIQILNNKIDSLTNLSKQDGLKFTALENELKSTFNEYKSTTNELKSTIQNKNEIIKNLSIDLLNQKKDADNKIDSLLESHNRLKNQSKSDFNIITVDYANIVNGYKVKVAWLPNLKLVHEHPEYISGPAILEFSNINDSLLFSVSTNNYAIKKDLFSVTYLNIDSLDLASLNTSQITIQNKELSQIHDSTPIKDSEFSFADLDFDGEKELIVRNYGVWSQGTSRYDIYHHSRSDDDSHINKITYSPFNYIDDYTGFDYAAKTIQTTSIYGVCASHSTTYEFKSGEIKPIIYSETDRDCNSHTYKIVKNLQLIK